MGKISALQLSYGAIFVCLMAIGANIVIWFPFLAIPIGGVSVPLSLQTFFAILAGLMLGKKLGLLSMTAYLLTGLAGVPVFAQMQAGLFVLFDYTGGFLLSFLVVAYVTGWLSERLIPFTLSKGFFIATVGVLVNYLIGVHYMFIAMNTWLGLTISYSTTWISMTPFFIKDIFVALIAAVLMCKIVNRIPKQIRLNTH
ncbi:biotin transport system substrate-specific component [Natronobacillus azotifigens]|uniref:Biotin transporter n=1 Tax=Natronobacillus azotifigens TaxID=472978 RepID=A0A9J6RF41_9BACI|nr:biotin transporter BioY [Natronobacillus azotifigens]MCZ0704256.1 biotin transporter BioY [Natronobacillus azotifigens]